MIKETSFENAVLAFSKEKYKHKRIKDLAYAGLECMMFFDGIISASVLLYNEETFEFEIVRAIPEKYPFSNVFDFLVDEGIIGKVLSTAEVLTNTDNQWDARFIILPMITQAGVIGLVLLDTTLIPSDYSSEQISLLEMFSSFFASSVAELRSELIIKEKSELLEQLVAMRTLHLEEKTKDLNERLESLTSNLMSSIPHEVRTPINQILGFTKYLKSVMSACEDAEDVGEIVNDIESSAERLKHLFENYLFHTNLVLISMNIREIESLQKKITYSAESVIYETVMNLAYNFKRQDDIQIDLADSPISFYEAFLVKVCEELISNAMKFSQAGTKITVKSYIEMNKYILIIRDTGKGMQQSEIEEIGAYIQFNRHKNEQQGLGLGLSIVNRIMNIHKSDWDIKSRLNEFTEVMLVLPVPHADELEALLNND